MSSLDGLMVRRGFVKCSGEAPRVDDKMVNHSKRVGGGGGGLDISP